MSAAASDSGAVLVVDDEAAVCWALEQALSGEGYAVRTVADAAAAKRAIRRERPDVVLTDIRMPGESGLDLLATLVKEFPNLPVIVMTAHGTMETAIAAVKRGAFDYLPKPLDLDRVLELVRRAMGEDRLAAAATPKAPDAAATNESGAHRSQAGDVFVGQSAAMQEVYRRVAAAAATDLGVLLLGPSGSGKELVARALHRHSRRADQPFVAVNCGALADTLIESELFGHEPGAFTDAKARRVGRVEAANGGTLFLDEVAELSTSAQVKLLRFLEDGSFTRLGANEELHSDVRVIAATHRDLTAMAARGAFREDLLYRLRVVSITMPALVDRLDDLPLLVRYFLERAAAQLGRRVAITDEAQNLLQRYPWPGNVRELKHLVEEAAVLATGGIIGPEHLRITGQVALVPGESSGADGAAALRRGVHLEAGRLCQQRPGQVYEAMMALVEEPLYREALARTKGNQLRAAELLGINRITLKKRMDALGIGSTDKDDTDE